MNWFSTFIIAILTGAAGLFVSGYVASMAVNWYRISSFEGGSGYFVIFTALGGMIAGLFIGVVVSRVVAAGANPGFLKGLGFSLLCMLTLVGAIGGVSRFRADVPPTMDGEELLLVVEARWPRTRTESPAKVKGQSFLVLGSSISHVQRKSERGALWKEDAHLVDGQWTVTGAVPIFTTRGTPTIDIALNAEDHNGYVINMPSRPGKKQLEWSEWYPLNGKGGSVMTDIVNYRYRVQKQSAPVRTETIGPFQVDATIYRFNDELVDGTTTLDGLATFGIRYNGKPIQFASDSGAEGGEHKRVSMVALLPGASPALIVLVDPESASAYCAMITEEHNAVRQTRLGPCSNAIQADELTSDTARFQATRHSKPLRGSVDRITYRDSELLEFYRIVLDVRSHVAHAFTAKSELNFIPSVQPLGVSPDKHSYVRFANANNSGEEHALVVTDFIADKVYDVPIDASRMRYGTFDELTPTWLMHHFEWQRKDGVDHLVERAGFVPIPYHGDVTSDSSNFHTYRIEKANQAVRMAIVDLIVKEFHGVREPVDDENTYEYPMQVEGQKLKVSLSSDFAYAMVSLDYEQKPTDLVLRIAKRFNEILATGRYDKEFSQKPQEE